MPGSPLISTRPPRPARASSNAAMSSESSRPRPSRGSSPLEAMASEPFTWSAPTPWNLPVIASPGHGPDAADGAHPGAAVVVAVGAVHVARRRRHGRARAEAAAGPVVHPLRALVARGALAARPGGLRGRGRAANARVPHELRRLEHPV